MTVGDADSGGVGSCTNPNCKGCTEESYSDNIVVYPQFSGSYTQKSFTSDVNNDVCGVWVRVKSS